MSLGDLDESSKLSKTVVHMGRHGLGGLHYLGWGGGQTLQQNRTNTISSQQSNVYWQPTPEASKQIRSLLSLGVPRRVELRTSPARCTGRRGVVVLCWFSRPTWFSSSLAGACVGDNLSVLHWLTAKVPTARIMSTFDLAIGLDARSRSCQCRHFWVCRLSGSATRSYLDAACDAQHAGAVSSPTHSPHFHTLSGPSHVAR